MDELLLTRARKGDAAAFEALVTPSEKKLWRLCWSYTRNEADASDCLQETMIKAWKSIPDFRGNCALESWLYRLCVNCCLDFLRKQKARGMDRAESVEALSEEGILPEDTGDDPAQALEKKEELRALWQAVDALPSDMREVLVLVRLNGESYENAAALLNISVGTVKSRLNRAREKLCKLLAQAEHSVPKNVR